MVLSPAGKLYVMDPSAAASFSPGTAAADFAPFAEGPPVNGVAPSAQLSCTCLTVNNTSTMTITDA